MFQCDAFIVLPGQPGSSTLCPHQPNPTATVSCSLGTQPGMCTVPGGQKGGTWYSTS
jgi:hypothetical protein